MPCCKDDGLMQQCTSAFPLHTLPETGLRACEHAVMCIGHSNGQQGMGV